MAPKGSPRMLLAASMLVTDGNLPVKVALSKAGFTAEEIAKEKKQRQVRRRRDFLLKKKAIGKLKGRRAMTKLPRAIPSSQKLKREGETQQTCYDTSRMDALIFACSMQTPISESSPMSSDFITSITSSSSMSSTTSQQSGTLTLSREDTWITNIVI